jgi:hypothetical protein
VKVLAFAKPAASANAAAATNESFVPMISPDRCDST